jgi:transposase
MTSSRQRKDTPIPPPQRSPYSIRPVHWTDLPALRGLRGETARLDMPEGIISGLRPIRTAARGIIPSLGNVWTFVLARESEIQAFAQARPRRDSHVWDVIYLAYGRKDRIGSAEVRDAMWAALLDTVTRTAGRRRATRLFARAPENADAMIALRDAGYIAYGREMLYVAPYHKAAQQAGGQPALHRQQGGETWAIHQLYTLTTPKAMQFAEARTSIFWDVPRKSSDRAAYWIGEAHEVTAYARTLSGEHAYLIDVLFRPEAREEIPGFVRSVLATLSASEGDLVYVRTLAHQEDLGGMLEALGFSLLIRQSLLVKYTTISVREAAPAFAPIPVLRKAVAGRVPSLSARSIAPIRLWRRIIRPPWPSHHGDLP